MELQLLERLALLRILPKEGSFATLKIIQKLKMDLALTEQEYKDLEVKEGEGHITWNPDKDTPREIPIGEKAQDIIVMSLRKSDRDGTLTEQELPVYEKFVKED